MPASYFTGDAGKCTVDGNDFHVTEWSVNSSVEEIEATTTADAPNEAYVTGPLRATGTCTTNWDADTVYFGSPINITPGQEIALICFLENASGGQFSFPTAKVIEITATSTVKGVTTVSFNWRATGTFTLPSAAF